jgi:hypothetical protein
MPVDEGATYECTGRTGDGEDVSVGIHITDHDPVAYTWSQL